MSRQEVVKTAEEYSRVAAMVCPNVTILYITEDEIVVCRDLLDSLVLMGAKPYQAPGECTIWKW